MDTSRFCQYCGHKILQSTSICPNCGSSVSTTNKGKSKLAAALLAFFLGGFGIHKFYLGRPLQGVFYLLFFWILIPGIIAFIEGIIYLVMSEEKFDNKYNR